MTGAVSKNNKGQSQALPSETPELIILDRAGIAKLFGWTERTVMRRLKTGALPPPIKGTSGVSARWTLESIRKHLAHPCE